VERFGIRVSNVTVWRALRYAGMSMKKVTKAARERDAVKRATYVLNIAQFLRHELVFVDESSFDRRVSLRNRGWALVGQRSILSTFFLCGKRFSVLPAISLEGILHVSIEEGAFNSQTFKQFIAELLAIMNPYDPITHLKNSVLIMDNCRIHKDPETLEMIYKSGVRCVFLPPYSPDFNPIELSFSWMKLWFKRNYEEVEAHWEGRDGRSARFLLIDMAFSVTPESIDAWYTHCGYCE